MDHLKAVIATRERLGLVSGRFNAARAACVELRACRILLADIARDKHTLAQAQDILRERSDTHHETLQKIMHELGVAEQAVATAERLAGKPKRRNP